MRRLGLVIGLVAALVIAAAPVAADTGGGGSGLFTVSVNRAGSIMKPGSAVISGTVTCDPSLAPPISGSIDIQVNEPQGRTNTIMGEAGRDLTIADCSSPTPWSVTIQPFQGKFAGGSAYVTVNVNGCDVNWLCSGGFVQTIVKLH